MTRMIVAADFFTRRTRCLHITAYIYIVLFFAVISLASISGTKEIANKEQASLYDVIDKTAENVAEPIQYSIETSERPYDRFRWVDWEQLNLKSPSGTQAAETFPTEVLSSRKVAITQTAYTEQ